MKRFHMQFLQLAHNNDIAEIAEVEISAVL